VLYDKSNHDTEKNSINGVEVRFTKPELVDLRMEKQEVNGRNCCFF